MNIQLLTPYIGINNNKNQNVNKTVTAGTNLITPMAKPLNADTVSFGNAVKVANRMADHVQSSYEADVPRLIRIATTFLDVLESVAGKSKGKYVFDRAYCEQSPVKSSASYVDKVTRSGSFDIRDKVRTTLYCRDLNDLSLLVADLLPELKLRGYVLDKVPMSIKDLMKRGYVPADKDLKNLNKTINVPDLDVRLDNVSDQVGVLPSELRYSISKPQKSGYKDIQMRLVRDFIDNKRTPVLHELLILCGENMAKAKHFESERIYSHLRKFDDLNIEFSDDASSVSSAKAKRYIELIETMMRGKVSQKLYQNAENKDVYDIADEIPIFFTESDAQMFENYFIGLKKHIDLLYREAKKDPKVDAETLKQLNKDHREDKSSITKIHDALRTVVDEFMEKTPDSKSKATPKKKS